MRNWLNDKTVVITGVTSGIGKALTLVLLEKYGVGKIIAVARNEEKLKTFISSAPVEVRERISYYIFDVRDRAGWENMARDMEDKNIVCDALINNAGIFPAFKKVQDNTREELKELFDTNFFAVFDAVKAVYPILKKSPTPTIYNISSAAALEVIAGTGIYSASKAAVKSLSEALIYEKPKNFFVGYACPGFIRTDLFKKQKEAFESNKLVYNCCMPVEKAAKKLARRIYKRKKRSVIGADAKFMDFSYRVASVGGPNIINAFLRRYGGELFKEVYEEDN